MAFRTQGCDLADKLMLALEGGAQNGQGDRRCTPRIPSDAASIEVDLAGMPAGSYLRLSVALNKQDPLGPLRRMFNTWRATHPCPAGNPDGGTGTDASRDASGDAATWPDGADAARDVATFDTSIGSGGTGSGGSVGAGGSGGAGGSSGASLGTGGSQAGQGGAAVSSGSSTAGTGAPGTVGSENGDDAGCACRAMRTAPTRGNAHSLFGSVLVGGALLGARRLRRKKNHNR